jgi:hypothetical protein
MASEKQINYIMVLANKRGLSTRYMDSTWKPYTMMRERSGTVRAFLEGIDSHRASELIDALK